MLRDDTVESSTGFANAAISITGGTLDLGTADDPGESTLNVNGGGSFLQNLTSNPVSAVGDTFEMNGTTVTVAVPQAQDSNYTFQENRRLNVAAPGVLADVSDTSGNPLSLRLISGPSNGSLQLNSDGSFTYTPNNGFVGTDSFSYVAGDSTADSNVASVTLYELGVVANTYDSGRGSLRQAILDVDATPGLDKITFDIPGTGVHTIAVLSALPTITTSVTIDGWSQPGFAGTPLIELDGASAGNATGLDIDQAPDTTIRGLVINRFEENAIALTRRRIPGLPATLSVSTPRA